MKATILKLSLLSAVLFTSCRTLYKPNAVNAPMLKEKGEAKIYVSTGNLQASYAVGNHVGVMLNGYYETGKVNLDNNDYVRTTGASGEAGVGYFMPFANNMLFEVYGGAGLGKVNIKEQHTSGDGSIMLKYFDANASKFYIQPTYGFVGKYLEVGLTPRFTFVKYDNLRNINYTLEERRDHTYEDLNRPLFAFFEPAVTVRGGYKWIKLQVQVGRSIKLSNDDLNYDGNLVNGGIVIDIAKWYNN